MSEEQDSEQSEQSANQSEPSQSKVGESFLAGLLGGGIGVGFALSALFVFVFVVGPCLCVGVSMCVGIAGEATNSDDSIQEVTPEQLNIDGLGGSTDGTASVGERFELDGFAYTIEDVGLNGELTPEIEPPAPPSGRAYVDVEYTIENLGAETAYSLTGAVALRDHRGRTFHPDMAAPRARPDGDRPTPELEPGAEMVFLSSFDVPHDAIGEQMTLVVSERNPDGDGEVEIPFTVYM